MLRNYANLSHWLRRQTLEVNVGGIPLGGNNPIRVQTMTNTNTNSTQATAEQCISSAKAGAEYVRITTQGVREAANIKNIKGYIVDRGFSIPLVADVHFNPAAAMEAAKYADKVRINPGNFIDTRAKFINLSYTDDEYQQELQRIEDKLLPLIDICNSGGVAIRIGVNHGSLSDRIMSRYGDTPVGMVESAMEFLRIFRKHGFNALVISMKSSNTRVMVQAVRLLVKQMDAEDMHYPLHLGVTEAGDGEDGRIKSAVGIGALLADGIGDTIRVSLTEKPEAEIPVAQQLVAYFNNRETKPEINSIEQLPYNPYEYCRRETNHCELPIGSNFAPVVLANLCNSTTITPQNIADCGWRNTGKTWQRANVAADYFAVNNDASTAIPGINKGSFLHVEPFDSFMHDGILSASTVVEVKYGDLSKSGVMGRLKQEQNLVLLLKTDNTNGYAEQRAAFVLLMQHGVKAPVIVHRHYTETSRELFQLHASADFGALLIDGLGDGIMISAPSIAQSYICSTAFTILQAARTRLTKTEYIACPGCGRTLYNLQETLHRVKAATSHLKNLKIGVMGCIVNGPGEMADADYGYVGAAAGKISLYKGKNLIKMNIPESEAIAELIAIIKENGDWRENV